MLPQHRADGLWMVSDAGFKSLTATISIPASAYPLSLRIRIDASTPSQHIDHATSSRADGSVGQPTYVPRTIFIQLDAAMCLRRREPVGAITKRGPTFVCT